MDLLLVFAIDLVQKIKSQNVLADHDLIAILELFSAYSATVKECPVSRFEVGKKVIGSSRNVLDHFFYRCMHSRNLGIVNSDPGFERAPQHNLVPFERDRDSDQVASQKDKRRPKVARWDGGFMHIVSGQDM